MGHRCTFSILIAVVTSSAVTAIPSPAQTAEGQTVLPATPIPLVGQMVAPSVSPPAEEASELAERIATSQQWAHDYREWKAWEDRWRGRLQRGLFGYQERRTRPDPPTWLFDDCRELADLEELADACELLAAWQDDYFAAQARANTITGRTQGEAPTKTTWWSHVHLDGLWVTPSASVIYGVVGIHVTLDVVGRWQVFVAPGAILLNVPTVQGQRGWRPATDLGFSYRLIDLRIPGTRRQGTLHVNLARAWLLGGSESFISSSVDLAGLSLTLK